MVTLLRFDVLPEDGPLGPKHVEGFNILISVKKVLKAYKILKQKM